MFNEIDRMFEICNENFLYDIDKEIWGKILRCEVYNSADLGLTCYIPEADDNIN